MIYFLRNLLLLELNRLLVSNKKFCNLFIALERELEIINLQIC